MREGVGSELEKAEEGIERTVIQELLGVCEGT